MIEGYVLRIGGIYSIMSDRIIWLYGNSGAGKTTLANRMKTDKTIILDGDALRELYPTGFTKEDRWNHNIRAAKMAWMLQQQGFDVIVAMICPYRALRKEITQLINPRWILVEGGHIPDERYPFER